MYCTAQEVKDSISFPTSGAPVSDSVITEYILSAQDEIENIYHTKFAGIEVTSTATAGSTTTLTDSAAAWTADAYVKYVVWIYGGTGAGQYREIAGNTSTVLTVSPAFTTAPDATSAYRITKLGYMDETSDGSGTDTFFVKKQPLINLNAVSIDSTSVTVSNVYQYQESGKLILANTAEVTQFRSYKPRLVNLKYIYGVYPIPRPIKRLAVIIASLKALSAQMGGLYDDFTNVSLPGGFTGFKGEPAANVQRAIEALQKEARGIVYGAGGGDQIGADFRQVPVYRPWCVLG